MVQGASVRAGEHRPRPTISGTRPGGPDPDRGPGTWSGTAADHLRLPVAALRRERRQLRAIPGATGPTYTVDRADVGSTLRVAVTATNAAGTATRDLGGHGASRRADATQPGSSLWHMDETSGTVMHDAVGGHDGHPHSVAVGLPGFSGTAFGFTGSSLRLGPVGKRPQPRQREPHGHDPPQDDRAPRRRRTGTSSARASTRPRAASSRWSTSPPARPPAASRARRATAS